MIGHLNDNGGCVHCLPHKLDSTKFEKDLSRMTTTDGTKFDSKFITR